MSDCLRNDSIISWILTISEQSRGESLNAHKQIETGARAGRVSTPRAARFVYKKKRKKNALITVKTRLKELQGKPRGWCRQCFIYLEKKKQRNVYNETIRVEGNFWAEFFTGSALQCYEHVSLKKKMAPFMCHLDDCNNIKNAPKKVPKIR